MIQQSNVMKKNMNELLLYALDNEPTSAQQADLEKALAESESLRQEKEQLLQIRSLVADLRVRRDIESLPKERKTWIPL